MVFVCVCYVCMCVLCFVCLKRARRQRHPYQPTTHPCSRPHGHVRFNNFFLAQYLALFNYVSMVFVCVCYVCMCVLCFVCLKRAARQFPYTLLTLLWLFASVSVVLLSACGCYRTLASHNHTDTHVYFSYVRVLMLSVWVCYFFWVWVPEMVTCIHSQSTLKRCFPQRHLWF